MKIAVMQVRSLGRNGQANAERALRLMEEARKSGADLALFPECFLTGYELPIPRAEALTENSPCLLAVREGAARLRMGAVITALTQGRSRPRNTAFLIGRDGKVLLRYDKVHTCDFADEGTLESGEGFSVASFDGIRIGLMICYDREYPESARLLMLQGAELILVPNDCAAMAPRLRALSTRAYENMVGVAMANPPGENAGRSCAYSPICWDENGLCVDNTLLLASEKTEGVFYADFDLGAIRRYRESEMMGNTFRKVGAYGGLLNPEVRAPFVREAKRELRGA